MYSSCRSSQITRMIMHFRLLITVSIIFVSFKVNSVRSERKKYEPTWESLDTRPLPEWYDDAKIGIFIHWGVFSVPSYVSEWFWYYWKGEPSRGVPEFMAKNYPKDFSYQEFAKDFTAEFFNPDDWANLFKKAGARYIVLTSKHHEGYTLWPSKYSFSWNAMDVGPHRDLVGELGTAVKKAGLHFGLYHSFFEWFNPIFNSDLKNNYTTQEFMLKKCTPEMIELVERYHPEVFWSDGDGYTDSRYWNSTHFLAWLYNDSPVRDTVVVNDRWGTDTTMKHGDFFSGPDRYNPGTHQQHKWESTLTIDQESWGFRRNADISDYMTSAEIIHQLIEAVSCGGNMLINIGPTKDGMISPIFQERLLDLGSWLNINGEGIYGSRPWIFQNDSYARNIWYTAKNDTVYAFVLQWPSTGTLILKSVITHFNNGTEVKLLGFTGNLKWISKGNDVVIYLPNKMKSKGDFAWTLKIQNNQ